MMLRRLVHHDHAARPGHRAGGHERVEIHRHVDLVGGQNLGRETAGNDGLELFSVAHAAGFGDQLAQRDADRLFINARPGHVAAHAEQPRAALLRRADAGELLGAMPRRMNGTQASVSTLLTIVGHAKRPEMAGNGGLSLGKPLPPFERRQQRGFLAADIRPRAAMNHDVQIKAGSLDVFA